MTQDAQFQILRRYVVAQPVELGAGQRHALRTPQGLDRAYHLFRVVRVSLGGFAPVNHRFPHRVPGSPVAAPSPLYDGRPRRGLGDEGACIDVHPGLDRLGRDDDPSVTGDPAQLLELGLAFHPTELGVDQQPGLIRHQFANFPVGIDGCVNRVHHHQGEGPGLVAFDYLGGELLRFVDQGKFPDRSFGRHAPEQLRGLRRLVDPQHVGAFPGVVDGVQDAFIYGGRHDHELARLRRAEFPLESCELTQGGGGLGCELDLVDHHQGTVPDEREVDRVGRPEGSVSSCKPPRHPHVDGADDDAGAVQVHAPVLLGGPDVAAAHENVHADRIQQPEPVEPATDRFLVLLHQRARGQEDDQSPRGRRPNRGIGMEE